jgi:hypothetical protein
MQFEPHIVRPALHTHAPWVHVWLLVQRVSHFPQLSLLVLVSTHWICGGLLNLQSVGLAGSGHVQAPPTHC